ncbi:MAG TPA: hypothetical protein VEU51_07515, partial [Candidatus Acidoferrales bacterium]|nr:hypothetical protein [Candidatus Acidoferrales bacterium]
PDGATTLWPVYVAMLAVVVPALSTIYPSSQIYKLGLRSTSAENFVLGLPFLFDKRRAPATACAVQFVVSGAEPGSYYVEIHDGACASGQGDLKEPGLTIYCGTDSWALVGRGELSPESAIDEGLLRLRGSRQDFTEFFRSFRLPKQRGARASRPRVAQRVRNSAA